MEAHNFGHIVNPFVQDFVSREPIRGSYSWVLRDTYRHSFPTVFRTCSDLKVYKFGTQKVTLIDTHVRVFLPCPLARTRSYSIPRQELGDRHPPS